MMETIVTNHSKKRCKNRLGVSKRCTKKIADKALNYGLRYKDMKQGNLKKYIQYLYNKGNNHANNITVYGEHVYIFKGNVLITILPLPNRLKIN